MTTLPEMTPPYRRPNQDLKSRPESGEESQRSKADGHAAYEYSRVEKEMDDEAIETLVSEYFEQEAPGYDQMDESAIRRAKYLGTIDELVAEDLKEISELKKIVSFGCGTGRRESAIKQSLGMDLEVYGLEKSEKMSMIARSRGLETYVSIPELIRDHGEGWADAAIILYSFIHLPSERSREVTLRALASLLRPQGKLILDVFNLDDKHEWPSKLFDGGRGLPPEHTGQHAGDVFYRRLNRPKGSYMHYFTVGEIAGLLEKCGFVVTRIEGVGHGFKPGAKGLPLNESCLYLTAQLAPAR